MSEAKTEGRAQTDEPKHVVALSGGKDSTAMSLCLKELHPETDFEYVITPTGDELPEMDAHWAAIEKLLNRPLKRIGTLSLINCIEREGMIPNFRARFCTRILKIEPFIDYMGSLPNGSIMYVGLRADEDGRLGIVRPDSKFRIEYPMRLWGWGIADVMAYINRKGLQIPTRTDCGCCFFQRLPEWKTLLETYPDRYQRYVEIEKKYGHTFRSPRRDTWPADLDGLRREIVSGRKMRKTQGRRGKKCRFCSM